MIFDKSLVYENDGRDVEAAAAMSGMLVLTLKPPPLSASYRSLIVRRNALREKTGHQ